MCYLLHQTEHRIIHMQMLLPTSKYSAASVLVFHIVVLLTYYIASPFAASYITLLFQDKWWSYDTQPRLPNFQVQSVYIWGRWKEWRQQKSEATKGGWKLAKLWNTDFKSTQKLFFTLSSSLKAVRENQAHPSSTILEISFLNATTTMLIINWKR